MNVLVLGGGNSNEREISLRSADAVQKALRALGHEALFYDPAGGYDGLAKFQGKVEVVFPILHGAGGEDGPIQQQLDKLGFNYVGSDTAASKLAFHKADTKRQLEKLGIVTPVSEVVDASQYETSALHSKPHVLKPIGGGSSIDTFIVRDLITRDEHRHAMAKYETMLLEELIDGIEITVPVLGDKALPVIEIIPPEGAEFDFENKYNGATSELVPPKNVSLAIQERAQRTAEQVHRAVGARHLSRTDMIVTPNDEIYVLEINTMPGMTDQSLLPKSAAAAGISMQELVKQLLVLALK